MGLTGLNSRCHQGCIPFWKLWGGVGFGGASSTFWRPPHSLVHGPFLHLKASGVTLSNLSAFVMADSLPQLPSSHHLLWHGPSCLPLIRTLWITSEPPRQSKITSRPGFWVWSHLPREVTYSYPGSGDSNKDVFGRPLFCLPQKLSLQFWAQVFSPKDLTTLSVKCWMSPHPPLSGCPQHRPSSCPKLSNHGCTWSGESGSHAQTLAAREAWRAGSDSCLGHKQAPKRGCSKKVARWSKIWQISTKPSQTPDRGLGSASSTTLQRSICKLEPGQQGWRWNLTPWLRSIP